MKVKDILNSKDYAQFLMENLTESQQDSMLLKYQVLKGVENLLLYGKEMSVIYKELAERGFELIDGKKQYINRRTVKKYYLSLKKSNG